MPTLFKLLLFTLLNKGLNHNHTVPSTKNNFLLSLPVSPSLSVRENLGLQAAPSGFRESVRQRRSSSVHRLQSRGRSLLRPAVGSSGLSRHLRRKESRPRLTRAADLAPLPAHVHHLVSAPGQ